MFFEFIHVYLLFFFFFILLIEINSKVIPKLQSNFYIYIISFSILIFK